MTAPLVFLDVNVFMYAAGKPHFYKDACVRIVADVENGRLNAAINTEIVQELLYRYSMIGMVTQGIQLSRYVLKLPLIILPVTETDMRSALFVFEQYHAAGLKPRDAIHAATLRQHHIRTIISADKDFEGLPFLTRIDPLDYQI